MLKIAYFRGKKIRPISLNLKFTPNTLDCYGFIRESILQVFFEEIRSFVSKAAL